MCASFIALLETWPTSVKYERDQDREFLQRKVFAGLDDRNTGFDSPLIPHFFPSDFLVVIDRCAHFGVEIIGIEVFAEGKELVEIEISPEPGYEWARRLARRYVSDSEITICATYTPQRWRTNEDGS